MEIEYGNHIPAQVLQISIQWIFEKSHMEIVWKSRMEIAYGNDIPVQVTQISIQRIFRKSHMDIVSKSRMEIAYGNRVWKSYTGASFANFDSADLSEIAYRNIFFKKPHKTTHNEKSSGDFLNWF